MPDRQPATVLQAAAYEAASGSASEVVLDRLLSTLRLLLLLRVLWCSASTAAMPLTSLCVATKCSCLLLHTTRSCDHPAYAAGVLMLRWAARPVPLVLRLQSATTGRGSSNGCVSTLANASEGPCMEEDA